MSGASAEPVTGGTPAVAKMTIDDVPSAELPYWRGLAEGAFRQPRCASCDEWYWPVRLRCPNCGSFEQEWVEVEARGTVYSWTRTWYPFVPERSEQVPYVVVLAEVPGAGNARVLGVLDGEEDGLAIGAPVVGRTEAPSERAMGLPSLVWRLAA